MLVGEAEIQMLLANTTVLESSVVCWNYFAVFSEIVYDSALSLRHLYVPLELHIPNNLLNLPGPSDTSTNEHYM
jgi:hypothetical protein